MHVVLNAAASFVFAYRTDWNTSQALVGMAGGVAVFIALYTLAGSSHWFRHHVPSGGLLDRALWYGTWMRSTIGMINWVGLLFHAGPNTFLSPLLARFFSMDLYAGMYAAEFVNRLGRTESAHSLRIMIAGPDPARRAHNIWVGDVNSLFPTFCITLTEGLILTLMLLSFSLLFLPILWLRTRWKTRSRLEAANVPEALT